MIVIRLFLRQQAELERQRRRQEVRRKPYDQLSAADKAFAFDEGVNVGTESWPAAGPGMKEWADAAQEALSTPGGYHVDLLRMFRARDRVDLIEP